MKFERNEIYTGLLVLVTVGMIVGAILLLTAPGIFHPQRRYQIFFDNAAGVEPGAPVSLAGRKIGQVARIDAPVPMANRPARYPEYEVIITVNIDRSASVYRNSTPRMQQNGLLGSQIIDFVGGTEDSGVADQNYKFVGQRVPDLNSALPKVLAVIEPVASTATLALTDLRKTIDNLNTVFSEQGQLNGALGKLRVTADNLAVLTAPGGGISTSFTNLQAFTEKLKDDHGPLMTTLENLQKTTSQINEDNKVEKLFGRLQNVTQRADAVARQVNALIASVTPSFQQSATNFQQMTDTLKRQPWRLILPTTKQYDETAKTITRVPAEQGGPVTFETRERREGGTTRANRVTRRHRPGKRGEGPVPNAVQTEVHSEERWLRLLD